MSIVYQSRQVKMNRAPITASGANDPVPLVATFTLTAALTVNNIIEMIEMPLGYVPIDVKVVVDDLDAGAGAVFKAGVITGNVGDTVFANRTCGAEFMTGKTTMQTGGVVLADVITGYQLAPSTARRSLGLQITTAPATGTTTGTIKMIVMVRPAYDGE